MKIQSKKTTRRMTIAYSVVGLIILFYGITLIIQLNGGKGDYIETLWDLGLFLAFVAIAFIILPSDYFEFTEDEIRFRDYRRRSVKISEIDYIFYKDKFILLETKDEKKYEISVSNYSEEELNQVKQKFEELNIRVLKEEEEKK